jgi:hypothetical protein
MVHRIDLSHLRSISPGHALNCLAATQAGGGSKDFLGFPIPSAAGTGFSSLTLLIIRLNEKGKEPGKLEIFAGDRAFVSFGDDCGAP